MGCSSVRDVRVTAGGEGFKGHVAAAGQDPVARQRVDGVLAVLIQLGDVTVVGHHVAAHQVDAHQVGGRIQEQRHLAAGHIGARVERVSCPASGDPVVGQTVDVRHGVIEGAQIGEPSVIKRVTNTRLSHGRGVDLAFDRGRGARPDSEERSDQGAHGEQCPTRELRSALRPTVIGRRP